MGENEGNCVHGRLNPAESACVASGGSCGSAVPLLRRWRARRLLVSQSLSKIQDLGTAVRVQSGGRARAFSCIFTELDR